MSFLVLCIYSASATHAVQCSPADLLHPSHLPAWTPSQVSLHTGIPGGCLWLASELPLSSLQPQHLQRAASAKTRTPPKHLHPGGPALQTRTPTAVTAGPLSKPRRRYAPPTSAPTAVIARPHSQPCQGPTPHNSISTTVTTRPFSQMGQGLAPLTSMTVAVSQTSQTVTLEDSPTHL